jgi:threonine synthase
MGATIADFIVSSNSNDILTRFINDGDMSARDVVPTLSPSMDIQVSSNFERLLFEMNGRDGGMTAEQLGRFRATGRLDIEADQRASTSTAGSALLRSTTTPRWPRSPGSTRLTGMVLDPHTATGTAAAAMLTGLDADDHPVITLGTAHPAKFPDAVERAIGRRPSLPAHLADLFERPERTCAPIVALSATIGAFFGRFGGRSVMERDGA